MKQSKKVKMYGNWIDNLWSKQKKQFKNTAMFLTWDFSPSSVSTLNRNLVRERARLPWRIFPEKFRTLKVQRIADFSKNIKFFHRADQFFLHVLQPSNVLQSTVLVLLYATRVPLFRAAPVSQFSVSNCNGFEFWITCHFARRRTSQCIVQCINNIIITRSYVIHRRNFNYSTHIWTWVGNSFSNPMSWPSIWTFQWFVSLPVMSLWSCPVRNRTYDSILFQFLLYSVHQSLSLSMRKLC